MKKIFQSPLFWIGLSIKAASLFFGGAENFEKLFIPFLDKAIGNWGTNPWSLFPARYFPYGSLEFLIFSLPKTLLHFLFGNLALGDSWLSYFSIKIVLLVFDVLLLMCLSGLAAPNQKKLLKYFWLNPVLFYISYIHGQLDLVPMYFSILSLIFLGQKDLVKFSIFAAFAALCKFHTIAVLPFAFAYVWNTNFRIDGLKKIMLILSIFGTLCLIGFWPQMNIGNISYISMGSPEALSVFSIHFSVDQFRTVYIGFLLIIGVLARLCVSSRITSDGLFYGSGLVYGTLVLISAANAGYYYWFLPFVCVFYATRSFKFISLFVGFSAIYLMHFVIFDFFGNEAGHFSESISFSLMQFSVLCLMLSLWISVIRYEAPLIGRNRPLMIGIAGNSGSGKNTVTEIIEDLFGAKNSTVVEGDDYHKWERGNNRWQDYTHLNPKANFLEELAAHTRALITGKVILQPHYDHQTGGFTPPRAIEISKNLVVQGLHTFYLRSLRDLFDLKIFLAPDEYLRVAWKLKRDVEERGQSPEKVLNSISSRKLDSQVHIEPQRDWADWVVESKPKDNVNGAGDFEVNHIFWNDTPIAPLLENLEKVAGIKSAIQVRSENIDQISVHFSGEATKEQIRQVAEFTFPCLRHLVRSYNEPTWRAGKDGLFQLVLLSLIERKNFLREYL